MSETVKSLIEMRIGKYESDVAKHPAPSQPDGVCRCNECLNAQAVLAELYYMRMAERHLSARQQASEGWQPISTAPRDPVQVWAAHPDGSPFLSFTAFREYGGGWSRPATADPLPFEPTHWRPLPAPPR